MIQFRFTWKTIVRDPATYVIFISLAIFLACRAISVREKAETLQNTVKDVATSASKFVKGVVHPSRKAGTRQTITINGEECTFRWIPAGEFDMGSPETEKPHSSNERLHHVTLTRGFWMLETEVTQGLYKKIMGTLPDGVAFEGDDLPVDFITYDDALEFCEELTKLLTDGWKATLPTEAQWEYACRAGTQTTYWYGNELDNDMGNYDVTKHMQTTPVRKYAPNPWGLYDMYGNVCEICLDWYGDYPSENATDPTGPDHGVIRVCRGGAWGDIEKSRSAHRGVFTPDDQNIVGIGFRILLVNDSTDKLNQKAVKPTTRSIPVPPKPGARQTITISGEEYAFRWIPAGEFDMGSPESEKGREDDEKLHHVTLTSGFWMLETEVTQELYKKIMEKNPSTFKGDNHPVENVSYNKALEFCEKLTNLVPAGLKATLPTEAQWEYACRAGTKTAFWYGDNADSSKMNYDKDMPVDVMSYPENPWGLYDMHGNVWEWTLDSYDVYSSEPVVDPVDLQENSRRIRVPRGGCWGRAAADCRSASRGGNDPYYESSRIGFRIVLIDG